MARAREAGALVRMEPRQGKGNVVRRMFADIEADIYVLVDGDDTYDAGAAPRMIASLIARGRRSSDRAAHPYRRRRLSARPCVRQPAADRPDRDCLFNVSLTDMLSGYRVFSRRFVKSFPFTAEGFGIETELTVHAVRLMMPMIGDGHALQGTAGGLGLQAQYLARRLAHPVHHRLSGARGAAAGVLLIFFGFCRDRR